MLKTAKSVHELDIETEVTDIAFSDIVREVNKEVETGTILRVLITNSGQRLIEEISEAANNRE